nr:PREDICTED: helicase with zinc finger domain 2-like isoform X1 [Lepisosteus oculatus]
MPAHPGGSLLNELLQTYDLQAACSLCAKRENEITYSFNKVHHQCNGDVLLVRRKGSGWWRPVSRRPHFVNPSKYEVCRYFVEGSGCRHHKNRCTFARSQEEAAVWNFQKRRQVDQSSLMRLVKETKMTAIERAIVPTPSVAEGILSEFSGEFKELCQTCFYSKPQTVAPKRWNNTCSSPAAHKWTPLLVHLQVEGWNKKVYNEIRHHPPHRTLRYCPHITQGSPCWHGSLRCSYAHSEVEMAVWKAEIAGQLNRKDLVQLSQRRQAIAPDPTPAPPPVQIYCKVCLLTFSSQESFINHCSSLEHTQMISEDTTTEWKYRSPPHQRKQEFVLCDRPDTCEYGDSCVYAHSVEEREEWFMRTKEAREKRRTLEEQGLLSYQDLLLKEYRSSSNEVHIMSDQVDDVHITCDKELSLSCERADTELKWKFHLRTERPLVHVALLKHEQGAVFTLGDIGPEGPCTYGTGNTFCTSHMSCDVPVTFKSLSPGFYEQWVVFDFDMRPVLLQKLRVRVGQRSPTPPAETPEGSGPCGQSLERWHRGNRMIVPCLERTEAEESLLKEYKPPQLNLRYKPRAEGTEPLTRENYRDGMHSFLYREELAQEEVASRLSLQGPVSLTEILSASQFGMKIAPAGELFATLSIPYALTTDTPEGYVLRRAVRSALIAPFPANNNKVFEAIIVQDASSENKIHLQLSKRCCSDLGLLKDTTREMEVQFQLNRLQFCEWHQAVDLLPDVGIVLPDVTACSVPVHSGTFSKLNAKQSAAMAYIIGDTDGEKPVAPLLIYGPFGTGKTFTLATAAKEVVRQPSTKVLICTHTNSSADLYVKDHFHSYVNSGHPEALPLRVKANKKGVPLGATDDITLKYCLLSEDRESFKFPDRKTLDSFRVVITTTVLASYFQPLKLPPGYFTHILIDEASQMLECAALMPLALAGKGTRVVLAGDHMQMGPKLFSVEEGRHSDHTLLNRLFHFYQGEKHEVASRSRIIFNENYRSTREIVEFVSTHFYVGKSDAIKAVGNVPTHPRVHPLMFHHVRGSSHLDTTTMSWFNSEEIAQVAEIVQSVLKDWPSQWGNPQQQTVCVLSEGTQVGLMRKELRKRYLGRVSVENLGNVQGRQFRVVVMTTIQTRDSLLSLSSAALEFFNEPRVLNTAMTRAQSQVIVVGDAAALCYFGKCSKIWRSYIAQCIEKGSAFPQHLTMEHIDQEVVEIARFDKDEEDTSSDSESVISEVITSTDEILQELMDDCSDVPFETSEEESTDDTENVNRPMKMFHSDPEKEASLESLLKKQPNKYKTGEIVIEKYDRAYVMVSDNPAVHIRINGRRNMGKTFSGDEVVVEITNENGSVFGKVMGILKKSEKSRVFVCTFEDVDLKKHKDGKDFVTQVMIPVNNSVTKIRTLCCKNNRNRVPIFKFEDGRWKAVKYQTFNEQSKRMHVFVVEIVGWKEHCCFPLGFITEVLTIGTSLDEGLKVLDAEFDVRQHIPQPVLNELGKCSESKTDKEKRHDFRNYQTFTIDPRNAEDLDDALSVRDLNTHYEIGIHITDVASCVPMDGDLDNYARERGATYYRPGKEPLYMFPPSLSTKLCSLLPYCNRRAISLILEVEKDTDRIVKSSFVLSHINSNKQFSYDEAEVIIRERYKKEDYGFGTSEDCLLVAYHFSRVHRKARLQEDWSYDQPDDYRAPGKRRAHQMIEELMIVFNSSVSDYLINKDLSKYLTPLRCQKGPKVEELNDFRKKYNDIIPMSEHLTYHIGCARRAAVEKTFCVLTSTWKRLQSAAEKRDFDKITDLISTDDIHPQLLPVILHFRRLLGKAYTLRSNSKPESKVGHYSLQLDSYTQASSPLRRYMDVILQRLLHATLSQTPVQYSPQEIDILCGKIVEKNEKANDYQKKAEIICLAMNLRKQSTQKLAFVVDVDPDGDNFKVSFPFDKTALSEKYSIMYRDLQLEDQPEFDKDKECMSLGWRRRVYSTDTTKTHLELQRLLQNCPCTGHLPQERWQDIIQALKKEDWKRVCSLLMNTKLDQSDNRHISKSVFRDGFEESEKKSESSKMNTSDSEKFRKRTDKFEHEHFVKLPFSLKPGDTLQVQLTAEVKRGFYMPAVQLLNVSPQFEVCLEHARDPSTCFSGGAKNAAKNFYDDSEDYMKIWRPLCEMESASTAVEDSDSIIIEDMEMDFKRDVKSIEGTFFLPLDCKKAWAIECDLRKCFLCIRKRSLKQECPSGDDEQVDPGCYTWVAHGITKYAIEPKDGSKNKAVQVGFYLNHILIENIPTCVFQKKTKFTVELIPKLLPDVRKETAVNSLKCANELVQKIALGHRIPRASEESVIPKREIMRQDPPHGLPRLNESQNNAIEEALKNQFTLIQGPPGTGKTVVGAYIVYWFFKLNHKTPRLITDPEERKKKEVILYCGPSNKSVDVVAEYLLKFGEEMKPLRVYSRQMEMLEYPYPGSILQLSPKSLRQERSKPELRSITLHHRIREEENPFSTEINTFDIRIQNGEDLTDAEINTYKDVLNKARLYELERHDVILCTCTAASTPNLIQKVSARQILIDECAMATEPQALVPLVSHKPEKIVLLGDQKQLRPIVKNKMAQKLGMSKSLFERYMRRAVMLDTQYRMHKDICEFPSLESYEGRLKTAVQRETSVFLDNFNKSAQTLFAHIVGEEISLVVSTEKGNENSKANIGEVNQAVHMAELLINYSNICPESIAILTPYNAQVSEIKKRLNRAEMKKITVSTITKSQGSEWRYVILSTVRSCPDSEIETEPSKGWLSKYVGFVGDPNQVNVGITRAQEGLCIIGNQKLLNCSTAWKHLLKHYTSRGWVINAETFSVRRR